MERKANQSDSRRKNQAVPSWEITGGAGKGGTGKKKSQPDQTTAGKEAAALQNKGS